MNSVLYLYFYVRMCVCVYARNISNCTYTDRHTHTRIYAFVYISKHIIIVVSCLAGHKYKKRTLSAVANRYFIKTIYKRCYNTIFTRFICAPCTSRCRRGSLLLKCGIYDDRCLLDISIYREGSRRADNPSVGAITLPVQS